MCVTMLVGITVVAAQLARENDSKDNTYDEKATYPVADAGALKTALAEAADGDSIMLTGDVDLSGETVSVDKDLTIKGEDTTLQNAYLEVADGKELSFDGVTIADTTIRAMDDADLTFTNCEFNVTPEKKNNNSRAAAIIGNHQYSNVNLTLQGCTFNYQPSGGADSKRHEPKARALCFAFLTGCPPQSRRDPFSAALGSTGASLPR